MSIVALGLGPRIVGMRWLCAGLLLMVGVLVLGYSSGIGFVASAAAQTSGQVQTPPVAAPSEPSAKGKSFLPSRSVSGEAGRPPVVPTGLMDRAYFWVMQKQSEINRALAGAVRSLKEGGGLSAAWFLSGLAFLYGVLHAAGPGHGKAVISSYVLADGQTMRRGVMLAFLAAFVQALAALVLVAVLAVFLKSTQADIKTTEAWLERASWGFVAVFGAWLLWRQLKSLLAPDSKHVVAHSHDHAHHDHSRHAHASHDHNHIHQHDHGPAHGHAGHVHGPNCTHESHAHTPSHGHTRGPTGVVKHGAHTHDAHDVEADVCAACGHAHMPNPDALKADWSWRRALTLAFAIGIRPCTGAILVLVFAISQGLLWAGVLATFAMAIGTAITVSILAALAVGSRDLATRLAGRGGGLWAQRVQQAAGVAGAALVMVLGASFFYLSLSTSGPF